MKWAVGAVIGVVLLIGIVGAIILLVHPAPCIKHEMQMVHHDGYTSYYYVGKTMIPQYHAAYDANESVCTEYEDE